MEFYLKGISTDPLTYDVLLVNLTFNCVLFPLRPTCYVRQLMLTLTCDAFPLTFTLTCDVFPSILTLTFYVICPISLLKRLNRRLSINVYI